MKKLTGVLILLFYFTSQISVFAQSREWQKKRGTDELVVYQRKADHSKIMEVKIEAIVEAPLSTIVAVLKDVDNQPNWIYACEKAEKLDNLSNQESLNYYEADFPWPLSNRDFITKSKLWQEPATKIVHSHLEGHPEFLPKKKGIVRIQTLKIHWTFTPLEDNKVKLVYELFSDPGGLIPAWMVNLAIDQGPVNTIKRFKEMLAHPSYQNVQFAFIEDQIPSKVKEYEKVEKFE